MVDVDVLVVGAGPSGLTVAAEVARAGASVLVIEKRTVEPIPRSGTVVPRPLELFDARGIAERFIRRNCEINPHPFQPWHIWAGMAPVDWSRRDSRFGFTLMLAQSETEEILRGWAGECGARFRFEHELVDLAQDADGVRATVRSADGETSSVTARYLVACDGGRSRTREAAGIGMTGHGDTFTGIIATVALDYPFAAGSRVGHNEHGWMSIAPFGVGRTRYTIVHAELRHTPRAEPVTIPELERCTREILGVDLPIPELVAASRYGDAMRMADSFRSGRVFLVGEAARVHYPASGVGMNFCIQDAFNLGWKLAAVARGAADDALLDSYEPERRPIAENLFAAVNAQVAVQFDFSPRGLAHRKHFAEHFLRRPAVTERLWDELNGLTAQYPQPEPRPAPVGYPTPDFEMFLRDGSSVRLYELLRSHPFVIVDLSGTGALRSLDVDPAVAVVADAHAIRRPASLYGFQALIVRPDTYLAWASETPPDPQAVQAELDRILRP